MIIANLVREELEKMDDRALGAACFAPLINAYKEVEGNGGDFVLTVYNRLSKGQQALFAFWTYYSHIRESKADLYWWSAYFMAIPLRWEALQASLRHVGDSGTLEIVKAMEAALSERGHPRSITNFNVSFDDLDNDKELSAIVSGHYDHLLSALPATLGSIAAYIRAHPDEFIIVRP
ncbi:hypothetical protein D3P07_14330 [Paenibacillus sp. 1011MAR3C5]|uniref:hypothetical protein n=1 Tax=Paenibacillus sp. 1011MAR3C5 TaxID=1675787 RepID=UPI000E6CE759|nr:hypothetical protein [Paenibacillus sp. 1011MAR3C5]RJE87505.1 hypothetical protein D3P07_14330 [Paenibacillus sp. 1011MAR3C5]